MPAGKSGTFHISFDIDGDRELSRKLHGMLGAVSDWSPAFAKVAADWSDTMDRKFAAEGNLETGSEQAGWAPLSPKYAAWKAKHYPGKGILQRTGALREAAVNPETTISPKRLRMVVNNPYGIYHQSSRPRSSNLPRRAWASFTAKQKARWVKAFRDQIHEAAK